MCMSGRWNDFDLVDTKTLIHEHPFRANCLVVPLDQPTLPHRVKGKIQKLFSRESDQQGPISHSIRVSKNNRVVIETRSRMGGKIRFSSNTRFPPKSDLSRLPGVYVVPGEFISVTDKPEELEAWERLRDRTKRLRTRLKSRKERRTSEDCESSANSKRWRIRRSRSQQFAS